MTGETMTEPSDFQIWCDIFSDAHGYKKPRYDNGGVHRGLFYVHAGDVYACKSHTCGLYWQNRKAYAEAMAALAELDLNAPDIIDSIIAAVLDSTQIVDVQCGPDASLRIPKGQMPELREKLNGLLDEYAQAYMEARK